MAQLCSQLSPLLSHVKELEICDFVSGQVRQGNGIDPTQWFELFDLFFAVQNLYIRDEWPSPPESIREDIQTFITARQHSDHPVDVHWY